MQSILGEFQTGSAYAGPTASSIGDAVSSGMSGGASSSYDIGEIPEGYSTTNSAYKTDLEGMNSGVLGRFSDGIEAKIKSMFTLNLPAVGKTSVYQKELPAFMGINLPALSIDLEDYPLIPTVRVVLVFCLYLWAFFRACKTVQGAYSS